MKAFPPGWRGLFAFRARALPHGRHGRFERGERTDKLSALMSHERGPCQLQESGYALGRPLPEGWFRFTSSFPRFFLTCK